MFSENRLDRLPPTAFQTAINYSGTQSVHEASGRVLVLGSDVFYSPNCSRVPPRPPPHAQTYVRNPLKDSVEEFHHPHWWSPQVGYLPFLPISPNLHCPPFHVLFNNPVGIGPRRIRIQMDSNDILSWNRLENALSQFFRSLQSNYSIPPMSPIIETSLCHSSFEHPSQFKTAETRCRGWFSIWMAMVSLGIAVAQISDCESDSNEVPQWYKTLARHLGEHRRPDEHWHLDEHTMSEIRQQLGQFSPTYPRAGVFIDLSDSQVQPTVEFFVRCGIPVWYPWGAKEESLARKNPNHWTKYIPPSHLLQRAHSSAIFDAPTSVAEPSDHDKPWETFFAERQRRATGPMPARKPTMKVYHWEKDAFGQWNRIQVVLQMQQETLADYGKRQKRFDERSNEWDCCTEMGELDVEELRAADWENLDVSPTSSLGTRPVVSGLKVSELPLHTPTFPSISYAPVGGSSSGSGVPGALALLDFRAMRDNYIPEEHSPADVLRLVYGFVAPPPSVRLHLSPPSEQQIKDLAWGAGLVATVEAFQTFVGTQVGKSAAHFFWAMSQTPWIPPSNILFDLATGNPRSLRKAPRLKFLHCLPGNIYIFDFKGGSTVDWKIAIRDVTDVLFILRLDDSLTDYEIVEELLNRGMPLATLVSVPRFTINPAPTVLRRLRLSGYSFGPADYSSYCLERDEILRDPRVARKALMRGGIIWRLAIDRAAFQDVLAGPTGVATLLHQCTSFDSISVSGAKGDTFWVDDVLDPSEADVISGVYYVYTGTVKSSILARWQDHTVLITFYVGQGTQLATMSWWPPVDLWASLVRQSFWHSRSESLYESRLDELSKGTALPLTNTQWRSRIKSASVVRRATTNNTALCSAFLKDLKIM